MKEESRHRHRHCTKPAQIRQTWRTPEWSFLKNRIVARTGSVLQFLG